MVFIPDADRGTLCVSSQVGCTLNCRFCHTGTMRLVRNLTAGEIVGQVMLARDTLGEWPSTQDGRLLTNIVMMGMGEPLYNFDAVRDALKIVMDGDGLALGKRRITLSTSGVVPMMARAGEEIAARTDQGVQQHRVRGGDFSPGADAPRSRHRCCLRAAKDLKREEVACGAGPAGRGKAGSTGVIADAVRSRIIDQGRRLSPMIDRLA